MHILHVVVGLDPALGGPPAVALRLASAQAQRGHHVTLAGHEHPDHRDAISKAMQSVPGIDRVDYQALPPGVRAGWFLPRATLGMLQVLVARAQIVHLHGLWEPLIRSTAELARRLRTPYVLAPHGMLDPWSLQQRWLKKKIALALRFRAILNRAACLHVLNEDEASLLKPLRLTVQSRVIPNGVFVEEIEPLPKPGTFRTLQAELGVNPFVLFLSRLHYKKGLDVLADAFAIVAARNAEVHLVVAGPDEGARADFENRIARAGIERRVHIVGPIWGSQKYAAMVDAACFCLPSRQEGFSMAITEAMACRLPVVITENCHFPEVGSAHAGEITNLEANQIAEALLRTLSMDSTRRVMGENGRALVLSQFTWPAIAESLEAVYREILGPHHTAAHSQRSTA